MTYTVDQLIKDEHLDEAKIEEAKQRMLAEMKVYELREARKAQLLSQKQLAKKMGVSHKRVSVIESGDVDHVEVSTLKRYLQGIGGKLSIVASLPDGKTMSLA